MYQKLQNSEEKRYAVYITLFFIFMGPLDYFTTYYGIYISENIQEKALLVQWAIQNNILAEFIFGSTLLLTILYICLYFVLRFLSNYTIKYTWYMYELILIGSVLFSISVVVLNSIVILNT